MLNRSLFVGVFCSSLSIFGEVGGIIGGNFLKNGRPYSAFVDRDFNTLVIDTSSLKGKGDVFSVMINANRYSVAGGATDSQTTPFAWIAPPSLQPQFLKLPFSGAIFAVSINNHEIGVIGGRELDDQYVALVTKNLSVQPVLNLPSGFINSVAINQSNRSLAGGVDTSSMVNEQSLSMIEPDGAFIPLSNLAGEGEILTVDFNDQQFGLAGGFSTVLGSDYPYVAQVKPAQSAVEPVNLGVYATQEGKVLSVALNANNKSIVGGFNGDPQVDQMPFAIVIGQDSSVFPVMNLPAIGRISSVAINSRGVSLLGGEEGLNEEGIPFAALVLPDQRLLKIDGLPQELGVIQSVALSETQVGIIGGQLYDSKSPYVAIVSPSGVLKSIPGLPKSGEILSVDIADLNPQSIGPLSTPANILFAASTTLTNLNVFEKEAWFSKTTLEEGYEETALVVSTRDDYAKFKTDSSKSKLSRYRFWGAPFYNYVRQKKQKSSVNYMNNIGGFLLGFDTSLSKESLVGMAAGYGFSSIQYRKRFGHGDVNEGFISLYGSYQWDWIYLQTALWTGGYSFNNERHTKILNQTIATSLGNTHGWLLNPHIELSCAPYQGHNWRWFVLEGFLSGDWANNWGKGFKEKRGGRF